MRAVCAGCLRSGLSISSVFVLTAASLGQTVLFEDAFDSEAVTVFNSEKDQTLPVGSTGWTFLGHEPNQNDARFGIDYSTLGVPEAPNSDIGSTATTGVALRTNVSLGRRDQAAIYYDDASFTGQYRVSVDMYLSWAAEPGAQVGTTEHGGLFIGTDTVSNPAATDDTDDRAFPASAGAGTLLATDGGTVNFDHLLLKNNVYPSTTSGQYSVLDFGFGSQLGYDNSDINTNPENGDLIDLPALFPELVTPSGTTQAAGAAGYRWLTIVADVDTEALGAGTGTELGTTTFSVEIAESGESYTLGTLDNSIIEDIPDGPLNGFDTETEQAPVDMSGRVSLVLTDFFTSVASDLNLAFVVFDNLLVTQVESGLDGDYNSDGIVDAADYTVWRDGNSPDSTQAGYDLWAGNFGATASAAAAVPEPASAVLLVLAAGALAGRRR